MNDEKYMALTFDDGPNTTVTPQVLDLLGEFGIKCSFFLVGNEITEETADVMRRMKQMGCEIDCHSLTHSDMKDFTAEQLAAEIDETVRRIAAITGERPLFFRPPYISYNELMFKTIDMPFICGSGCDDWDENVSVDERVERILAQASDGTIILLHDQYDNYMTVEALKRIIPALQEDGYRLVTVSELFRAKGITPLPHSNVIYTNVFDN